VSASRSSQSLFRNHFSKDAHPDFSLVSRREFVELSDCALPFASFEILVHTPSSHLSIIVVGAGYVNQYTLNSMSSIGLLHRNKVVLPLHVLSHFAPGEFGS
jgi:hypothetical protein